MSQALGAAVRVQYMRAEGTGWDPKGPASIHRARACLDTSGKVVGYRIDSRGFSRTDIATTESDHAHSLAGQLMGMKPSPTQEFGIPTVFDATGIRLRRAPFTPERIKEAVGVPT